MQNQDLTGGARSRRGFFTATVVAAAAVLLAGVAAPAGARPPKDKPGKGRGPVATEPAASEPAVAEPTAEASSTSVDAGTLRRAALRFVVTTTSDWVQVDVPGVSAGHVVVDGGGREVLPTARGVVVRGPGRVRGEVTVDVVVEVPRNLEQGFVSVAQGGAGKTTTEVLNRTAELLPVATVETSWSATQRTVITTADELMGPDQLEWVRADDERRVLAFTYPWFGEWAETADELPAHPTDPWVPSNGTDALEMAEQARAQGIDGFVMSFSGGARHGLPLYHSLNAAAATGGTATVLIETAEAASADVTERWIAEALRQSDSPAFQRLDGVPVVFAFATGTLTSAEWQGISDRLAAAGTPVHIVGDTWHGAMTGQYRYNALLESPSEVMTADELTAWNQTVSRGLRARATLGVGDPGLVVATVQPGWDDRLHRGDDRIFVERDGTATYDATWDAALAGEADWVVITSWNEWYEATGIAPSAEHGENALRATGAWAARFGG